MNWTQAPDPNRYLYDNPILAAHARAFLDEVRPDIVHITSCQVWSAGVIHAAKEAGIPVVLTLTDFWFLCPRTTLMRSDGSLCDGRTTPAECLRCTLADSRFYRLASRSLPDALSFPLVEWISRHPSVSSKRGFRGMAFDMVDRKSVVMDALAQADRVIAPTRFLADTFSRAGCSTPMSIVPYGHDLSWVAKVPRPARSGRVRIGYTGQIANFKGVHCLIEAFRAADLEGRAQLDIWGDLAGADPAYVERLRAAIGDAPSVFLRGRFDRDRLPEVLGQLDVVAVPSLWWENAPLVIHEAFAAGVPVIATDLPGMAEVVDREVNGLLFRRGDVRELAANLRRLVEEPDLIERLRAGIPPVKTTQDAAAELEGLYREMLPIRTSERSHI